MNTFLLTPILQESNQIIVIRDAYPTLFLPSAFEPLIQSIFGQECIIKHHEMGKLTHENQDISIPIPKQGTKQQRIDHLVRKLNKKWQHSIKTLLFHQLHFVTMYLAWIPKREETSCLLYYSVGSGKSLSAISTFSYCYVQKVYIICGNSLILQWLDELHFLPQIEKTRTTFIMLGFQEFINQLIDNPDLLLGCWVIFDEIHLLFKRTERMQFQIECLLKANHLFLLTATPILRITDVPGLCQVLRVKNVPDKVNSLPEAINLLKKIDRNRAMIHYYDPRQDPKARNKYAPFTVIKKRIPMTWTQTLEYVVKKRANFSLECFTLCSSSHNAYHTQQKKTSNLSAQGDCPKLQACAQEVVAFNKFPQLIMVFYLEDGEKIYQYIKKINPNLHVEYETGNTTTEERERYRKQLNKKKLEVLILSAVGSYGLNFLGVKGIHVFSYENNEYKKQAEGRGLRYNAHTVDEETKTISPVIIFHYLSIFPSKESIPKDLKHLFYITYVKSRRETDSTKRKLRGNTKMITNHNVEDLTNEINEWLPFDFNQALLKKLQNEEQYKTIDELLEVTNQQKEVENQLLLDILQSFSI